MLLALLSSIVAVPVDDAWLPTSSPHPGSCEPQASGWSAEYPGADFRLLDVQSCAYAGSNGSYTEGSDDTTVSLFSVDIVTGAALWSIRMQRRGGAERGGARVPHSAMEEGHQQQPSSGHRCDGGRCAWRWVSLPVSWDPGTPPPTTGDYLDLRAARLCPSKLGGQALLARTSYSPRRRSWCTSELRRRRTVTSRGDRASGVTVTRRVLAE